jgi:hypothetical protein
MGGNASVLLATHFLFSYEYAFLEQLVNAVAAGPACVPIVDLPLQEPDPSAAGPSRVPTTADKALCLLHSFQWITRYIDDILAFDNKYLPQLLYTNQTFYGFSGIYPPELNITLSDPSPTTNYLDISLSSLNGDCRTPLQSTFYSKFDEPQFAKVNIIKYTHMSSNIHLRFKYNILTGCFHRLRRNLTSRNSFIEAMARVLRDLATRGYRWHRLRKQLRRLCHRHPGIFGISPTALSRDVLLHAQATMENSP